MFSTCSCERRRILMCFSIVSVLDVSTTMRSGFQPSPTDQLVTLALESNHTRLPLYLGEKGLSDRAIGLASTLAALSGLAPAAPTGPLAFLLGFLALVTMGLGMLSLLATILMKALGGIALAIALGRMANARR